MAQLEIHNLTFKYPTSKSAILDNISLKIKEKDWIVLTGPTGSGKTTLLKMIKKELTPYGEKSGAVYFNGKPLEDVACGDIGFVFQNPESQIVSEYVWSELAFGLENCGLAASLIRRRIGETAHFFGINRWFHKKVNQLSGGEKQILNLASIIAMQPKLLLLDEPTARLDPFAAEEFHSILNKINRELGITIILVEHQLEDVFASADRILVLSRGRIVVDLPPRLAATAIGSDMVFALPAAARLHLFTERKGQCPLSVREGQDYLRRHFVNTRRVLPQAKFGSKTGIALLQNLWFRYCREGEDILRGLRLQIKKGEILTILGGNGSGKSTLLRIIAGVYKPYRGCVKFKGVRAALLPQSPEDLFLGPTIAEDLQATFGKDKAVQTRMVQTADKLGIKNLLNRNFYDLSGGERQKAGLLKILLTAAELILLDEPTKGLDAYEKTEIGALLKRLKENGITVLIVTHDIEFAAAFSDRCALLFAGEIVAVDIVNAFFTGNNFYTTAAARISRGYYDNVVTTEDLLQLAKENGMK